MALFDDVVLTVQVKAQCGRHNPTGYRYSTNQSMPSIAPGNTTMAFGDFSKFVIRRVSSMSVRRLVERSH